MIKERAGISDGKDDDQNNNDAGHGSVDDQDDCLALGGTTEDTINSHNQKATGKATSANSILLMIPSPFTGRRNNKKRKTGNVDNSFDKDISFDKYMRSTLRLVLI